MLILINFLLNTIVGNGTIFYVHSTFSQCLLHMQGHSYSMYSTFSEQVACIRFNTLIRVFFSKARTPTSLYIFTYLKKQISDLIINKKKKAKFLLRCMIYIQLFLLKFTFWNSFFHLKVKVTWKLFIFYHWVVAMLIY